VTHINKLYLYTVLSAAVGLALLFGVPLSSEQAGGIETFLAVLFGVKGAYDDPRVPVGK